MSHIGMFMLLTESSNVTYKTYDFRSIFVGWLLCCSSSTAIDEIVSGFEFETTRCVDFGFPLQNDCRDGFTSLQIILSVTRSLLHLKSSMKATRHASRVSFVGGGHHLPDESLSGVVIALSLEHEWLLDKSCQTDPNPVSPYPFQKKTVYT